MKKFIHFLAIFLIVLLLSGCSKDKNTIGSVFSGTVKDNETSATISGVTVELATGEGSVTETDGQGRYSFDNVKQGKYNLSFTKTGYEYLETNISVGGMAATNKYDAVLRKVASTTASVIIRNYLAISDGIYYYFEPSPATKTYYWDHYTSSNIPDTDDAVITHLVANGVRMDVEEDDMEGWSYDLSEQSNYVICAVAFDANGNHGQLYRRTITTKSSVNQPKASLNIKNINTGTVTLDITKNSNCNTYTLQGWYNTQNYPDIYWADAAYSGKTENNTYSENFTNVEWDEWGTYDINVIVSLGYDSNGNVSGVIDKKYFSTRTNQELSFPSTKSHNDNKHAGKVEKQGIKKNEMK
jgi:hypothetical protein